MSGRRRDPLPEELLLGAWLAWLMQRAGWNEEEVGDAVAAEVGRTDARGRRRPYAPNTVSNWLHGHVLASKDVVRWFEEELAPGMSQEFDDVAPGFLLHLRRLAVLARRRPGDPDIRDGIHDEQLAPFKSYDLARYRCDLDASSERSGQPPWDPRRSTTPSLECPDDVVARIRSFASAWTDGSPIKVLRRGAREGRPRTNADRDRLIELAIDLGPGVGGYAHKADTARLIAASPGVLRAIRWALRRGDPRAVRALIAMAGCAFLLGLSLKRFERRALAAAADDDERAAVLLAVGLSALGASDTRYAQSCFMRVFRMPSVSATHIATSLLGLAEASLRLNKDDGVLARRALPSFADLGDPVGIAHAQLILAQLALRRGDLEEASRWFIAAADGYVGRDRLGEINTIRGLADVALRRRQYSEAHRLFGIALDGYEALGYVLGRATCMRGLIALDLARDCDENAQLRLSMMARLYAQVTNPLGRAHSVAVRAELEARRGRLVRARLLFRCARWLYDRARCAAGAQICAERSHDLPVRFRSDGLVTLPRRDHWAFDDNG